MVLSWVLHQVPRCGAGAHQPYVTRQLLLPWSGSGPPAMRHLVFSVLARFPGENGLAGERTPGTQAVVAWVCLGLFRSAAGAQHISWRNIPERQGNDAYQGSVNLRLSTARSRRRPIGRGTGRGS
jgi:hypothetical protein